MRPISTIAALSRTCIGSSSRPRPIARCLPPHPPTLPRAQIEAQRSVTIPGWDWLQSRLAIRDEQRSAKEVREARGRQIEKGEASLFDTVEEAAKTSEEPSVKKLVKKWDQHKYSTALFKISPRKLGKLSKQINGKPIDVAILQMMFSDKRASGRIKSTLCLARDHAEDKGLRRERLVVAESWVGKGRKLRRLDIKGRGRHGIKHHPQARLNVVLKEGKTREEKREEYRLKVLGRVRSAGLAREDVPIRNAGPMYAW